MKSIEKKILNSFKNENITFCLNNEYAFEYSFVLIFFKSIIIRNFSFFQITKIEKEAEKTVFNEIFCIRFFLINEFRISFIVLRFFVDIEYEVYFSFSTFVSFLNEISILMSSLNFFKFDLNSLK